MATDLLEAFLGTEFGDHLMENPDLSNKALAVVDRVIEMFGNDIAQAKIKGPVNGREGFDIQFKLSSRGDK